MLFIYFFLISNHMWKHVSRKNKQTNKNQQLFLLLTCFAVPGKQYPCLSRKMLQHRAVALSG